jgi:uncharacterized protein YndB with AHSA1/START domain
MKTPLIIRNEILIHAPAWRVWDALINPQITIQYMFGCVPVTDWKEGSLLLWRGSYEGKEMDFVKGQVVRIEPGSHLSYTVIDPNNQAIPDVPENYLTVTCDLVEEDGSTRFIVTQGDYALVAEGEKRFKDSNNGGEGWNPILVQIKKIVERE